MTATGKYPMYSLDELKMAFDQEIIVSRRDSLRAEIDARGAHDWLAFDADLPGVKHDPNTGQFSGSGTSGGGITATPEKKKISKSELKTKLEGMSHAKLMAASAHKDTDPAIRKMIEAELDDRPDRGTMKGHGEEQVKRY